MADEITPALTPEEWGREAVHLGERLAADIWSDRQMGIPRCLVITRPSDEGCDVCRIGHPVSPEAVPKLMALANAALADDDPRKITREDVEFILYLIKRHRSPTIVWGIDSTAYAPEKVDRGDALAAKLAALLPPNEVQNG